MSHALGKSAVSFFENQFVELVIASAFDSEFVDFMQYNRKNVRLLVIDYLRMLK